MKLMALLTMLLACTTAAWAQDWPTEGRWVTHTLPADRNHAPLNLTFELPDYIARLAASEIPQWKHNANDSDYFQVLFGGHDPRILRASIPQMDDARATQQLYERTLKSLRQEPERYRNLQTDHRVGGPDGQTVRGILYEEIDTSEDLKLQRRILEEALSSLPPAEREKEIQKNLEALAMDQTLHLDAFALGKKVTVTVHFTKQSQEAKKKIADRLFASLKVR